MICRKVYIDDGSVAVIHPAPNSRQSYEKESEWLERIFTKTMNKNPKLIGRDFDDVDVSTLPSREFRNAWRGSKGEPITIDSTEKQNIINEKLILEELEKDKRDQAIAKLKSEGKLPFDYE